jgi:mycofactocin system glycosyltransferase
VNPPGSNGPSPLLPAPAAGDTPLPGSFSLEADPATARLDAGSVLMGGSPLRLFRLSPRARALVGRWSAGDTVGDRPSDGALARRLVSSGSFVAQPRPDGGSVPVSPSERDVTVVVPVRDRTAELDRLLGALAEVGGVVVVDDASADPAATEEVAARHGATFVALASNVGPAGARNAGLSAVHTPIVAFVDSDCLPAPGWLAPLLGYFRDPLTAAAAPRVVGADDRTTSEDAAIGTVLRYAAVRNPLDRGTRPAVVRPLSPVPFVPSAALLVRRDLLDGSELFDPRLRGGEDVDLVWRLVEAGWDVHYVPESTVVHDGPVRVGPLLGRRAFYGSTAAALSRRHAGAVAPVSVSGWSLAVWTLVLRRRPAAALAVLGGSVGLLAWRLKGLVRDPVAVATRIAAGGTVRAALPALGDAVRAWSPLLALGLLHRRTRRASALALLAPALRDWAADSGGIDPIRYTALHVADDLSYGAGVWLGCARERTVGPLVPRVSWRARVWSARTLRETLGGAARDAGRDQSSRRALQTLVR